MLLTACALCIGQQPATQPVENSRARGIVRDLADPDPQVRQLATLQLNSLGADALPVIEEAAKNDPTPERQRRLQMALKVLRPRAAIERRDADIRNWESRVFHDVYDHNGQKGGAWDLLAQKAIEIYLPLRDTTPIPAPKREAALAAFQLAADAGCGDPMILAMYKLAFGGAPETHQGPVDRALGNLLGDIKSQKYPLLVYFRLFADYLTDLGQRGAFERRKLVDLLPELAATPGISDEQLYVAVRRGFVALGASDEIGGFSRQYVDAYKKLAPGKAGPLVLEALLNVREADFSVRLGSTWVDQAKRLKDAEKALEDAAKINDSDPRVRDNMVFVQFYLIENSPEQFNQAFTKAIAIDPDNAKLYALKLKYISPGWRGDEKQLLEFGRECLKTENWRANVPFELIQVHELLAGYAKDATEYFARADVWQDVLDVYKGHLVNFPDDRTRRCEFAKYATKCGKWEVAYHEFEIIGDTFDPTVFASKTSYDYLRKKAARLAAAQSQGKQ
jgi:hypothetical protein